MYYVNIPFNSSMIFSTIEIMMYLKSSLFLSSMGIGYLYELKVLFKRFVDMYSMENISMKRLDEVSKQPAIELKNVSIADPNMSVSL